MVRQAGGGFGKQPKMEIDPISAAVLREAIGRLVADYGRAAVLYVAQESGRRHVVEASRAEKEELAVLIDALKDVCDKADVFRLVVLQKNAGIPLAVTNEILGRVAAVKPVNLWGFVQTLMHKDYPHYAWGRK